MEMADRISERRQNANAFFLTINTILTTAVGGVWTIAPALLQLRLSLVLATAGIILSFTWYRLIRSYKDLNSGKFSVIHSLEKRLPAQPYADEWIAVGEGKDSKRYLPFTQVETKIPWVFVAVYVALVLAQLS